MFAGECTWFLQAAAAFGVVCPAASDILKAVYCILYGRASTQWWSNRAVAVRAFQFRLDDRHLPSIPVTTARLM